MTKPVAWSYSRLTNYESCPKKYYHLSVLKDFKEAENEHTKYGKEAHKAIELRISKGKKLPTQFEHLEPIVAKFASATGTIMVEQQLALNHEMQPTGWFDKDVFCRSIIDYAVVNKDKALIVDWKTGKISDDFTQQQVAAAMFFIFHPEVRSIDMMYYWLKDKKHTVKTLEREDAKTIWATVLKRVRKYVQAHSEYDFPPRPNYLCGRYCPITSCPHNGQG